MSAAEREVVLITGISGSGKSVALHALEDIGFFCIDNLPPELLREFLQAAQRRGHHRIAIGVDVRSASLGGVPELLVQLRTEGVAIRTVFLDANGDALVRRFSETRRPHPLTKEGGALVDAIARERQLLEPLREGAVVIDTSDLRPAQMRAWMRDLIGAHGTGLTLVFESFAYKHGVPRDADFVFDLRALPNPHYVRELSPLTGRDAAVAQFLRSHPEVDEMLSSIETFLRRWLAAFEADQRSYLTVALGCTGGHHRSVYAAEALARSFATERVTLVRHRELDATPPA